MLTDELGGMGDRSRREQAQAQIDRTGPREGILKEDFLTVVPGVAAEDFVRAFARLYNGEIALDLAAEQQQRGIDICHAGQVARVGGGQERGA